jgi:hypothetical protein
MTQRAPSADWHVYTWPFTHDNTRICRAGRVRRRVTILPLFSFRRRAWWGWHSWVDEELRRELLARRDEDERVRQLVFPPKGRYVAWLSDDVAAEWQRAGEENTRWLVDSSPRGLARPDAGRWGGSAGGVAACPARRPGSRAGPGIPGGAARRTCPRGGLPGTPGLAGGQGAGPYRAASASWNPVHRHRPGNPGPIRSRTHNDWTSAAQRRGLNRSLSTKPEGGPGRSRH